eukprot:TRINITY_DN73897_c0_g1_i1.p1 TRINITY_DN73897_c0_g1~~TRINITY_DN73897_c0_g1_i1.p1  ORF type:complete len:783 (-),score=66.77 TRINITY_DN73897_c0_g1_i1:175-2403(-)
MALSKKTATGKDITLDHPVERLWPEFCRGGKGTTTIRQLLLHEAGLKKPFKNNSNYKTVCSEAQMEKSVAASPLESSGTSDVCRVLGVAAAALMRRATGHKTSAEALKALLEPLGLQDDVVYVGADERMVHASHKLLEEVTMVTMWEAVESHQKKLERGDKKLPPWLSWQELGVHQGWCIDPLLVNCKELREGTGCMTGRGLRASARATCLLYASDVLPPEILSQCSTMQRRLQVESLEEWRELCGCLDIGVGLQVFTLRSLTDDKHVHGFGYADGSTGSITMRVRGHSVAVLLNCVDKDTRHFGYELLRVIAKHFDLEPIWQSTQPDVPETSGNAIAEANVKSESDIHGSIARLEAQMERLTQVIGGQALSLSTGGPSSSSDLSGVWDSVEIDNMDVVFDLMQVPSVARTMARQMKTQVDIQIVGNSVSIANSMKVMGRQIHATKTSFTVGEPFTGEGFKGKTFQGLAKWLDTSDGEQSRHGLSIEKRMKLFDEDVCLEERYELTEDGTLSLQLTVRGQGDVTVTVNSEVDRDLLLCALDRESLRLTKEVRLGARQLLRGGSLLRPSDFRELTSLSVPHEVTFHYADLKCSVRFSCQGGPRIRGPAQKSREGGNQALSVQPRNEKTASFSCCGSIRSAFAALFYAVARACEGEGHYRPSQRPSDVFVRPRIQPSAHAEPLPPASSKPYTLNAEPALHTDEMPDSGEVIQRQISDSIVMGRRMSGLSAQTDEESVRAASLVQ